MEQSGIYSQNDGAAVEAFLQVLALAFVCLWIYVGADKVFDYADFRQSMINQPFDDEYGIILSYGLPLVELGTGVLFVFKRTRLIGFGLTILWMLVFSAYVILALSGIWGAIPCGCILEFPVSWESHLWINGGITIACITGLLLNRNRIKLSQLTGKPTVG